MNRSPSRRSRQIRARASALLAALILLSGCADEGRLSGSGSVTTNGFAGLVVEEGLPVAGARVSLYPGAWNPLRESALPDVRLDTTDALGRYRFEDVPAGAYNLVASRPESGMMARVAGLSMPADGDSLIGVADAPLGAAGAVEVGLPEFAREQGGYLYLPGTGIHAAVDSSALAAGKVRLAGVPAGAYPSLLYMAPGAALGREVLPDTLRVAPGGAGTVKPFALWKRAYRLSVNTSPSGAAVAEDLAGFPLLVRLHAGNFDFSAAATDGSDLRITKADSATVLAYDIEAWDAAAGTAAVWVRMDTVRGGDATQSLRLFAGLAGAAPASSGSAVFDTASGFQGVWHLGESPARGAAAIRDRTAYGHHGTPAGGMGDASLAAGVVGMGLVLDGRNDHVELPASERFLAAGRGLSLSAWIRPGPVAAIGDSIRHRLISFKEDSAGRSSLAWGLGNDGKLAHYSRGADTVLHWSSAVSADSVYHVALIFEGGRFTGYLNGRQDFSASGLSLGASGGHPALVGAHVPGDRNFQGLVDELRIEKSPRGAAWIRLSFETQRPGARVVGVEPAP